ncbi:MAG: hypothetical protein COB50_01750 [Thiotrichales bacterium]|nr:MAG: hypothetical protein COB50_01750 [Thiotrichales bacterium]
MLRRKENCQFTNKARIVWVFIVVALLSLGILARVVYLGFYNHQRLLTYSKNESIRYQNTFASRGIIYDRNGVPLAVSTPVYNVVFNPKELLKHSDLWKYLIAVDYLHLSRQSLINLLNKHSHSQFLYVKKNLIPSQIKALQNLNIPGVDLEVNWKTFYPLGAMTAQLVGFTDAHNAGQSGLEMAYENYLNPMYGKRKVIQDAQRHTVTVLSGLVMAKSGKDIQLSIDSRMQFLAYLALKDGVELSDAESGSVVVLDVNTGEVLAAASYPSFNPNIVGEHNSRHTQNTALTGSFEPGSVMKPLIVAAALKSGTYTKDSIVNTSPGWYFIHGHKVKDEHNYGKLDLAHILAKSSNVGASRIALSLKRNELYDFLNSVGLGENPTPDFPAGSAGYLPLLQKLDRFSLATLSFGYSLTVTTLQLARAYSAIANGGVLYPISLLRVTHQPKGVRVLSENTAADLRSMLRTVMKVGGTGMLANIVGYKVAGKTGTSYKASKGGFNKKLFNGVFVGMAPLNNPKLVIAVHMNNIHKDKINFYGGIAAAPVFSLIMENSLRLLDVPFTNMHINKLMLSNQKYLKRLVARI